MEAVALISGFGEESTGLEGLLDLSGPGYVLALRICGSPDSAEDILQQAYLNACRHLRRNPSPREMRNWFLTVVANEARKHLRSEARRARRESALEVQQPIRSEAADADIPILRKALQDLDPGLRSAVSLCYEQGLTRREAAAVLDIPRSTLGDRVEEGLKKLRRSLEKAGYPAATAGVVEGLRHTAPALPAGLAAKLEALVAGALGAKTAVGTAATAGSIALGWKLIAGLSLAALAGFGGWEAWRNWGPNPRAAVAPRPVSQRETRNAKRETVTIVPRTHDARLAFRAIEDKGGPEVVTLGDYSGLGLLVPVKMRFREVGARELIEAVAASRELKVAWARDGSYAVLYRKAPDAEIGRVRKALLSEDVATRREGAWLAGWQRDVRTVPLLVKAAKDADAEVRRQALTGLRRMNWEAVIALDETAGERLEAEMASRDATVRRSATRALGSIGGKEALALLKKALDHKDQYVRSSAAYALGRIGGQESLTLLKKALDDKASSVRSCAAVALGRIGGKEALALLEKALDDKDLSVRSFAARALDSIGGKEALALLKKALDDKDRNVRSSAARALGSIGGQEALALLKKAIDDKEQSVRGSAAYALGLVGGDKARDLLLTRLAAEKDRQVLLAVSRALRSGFQGDPRVAKALKNFKLPEGPGPKRRPRPEPEPPEVF